MNLPVNEVLVYMFPGISLIMDVKVSTTDGITSIEQWELGAKQPSEDEMRTVAESGEFKEWQLEQARYRIDRATGMDISKQLHELCGDHEIQGILRDQIARMLNGDLTPSDDFAHLNDIAIAEIEKARIEKEAL